MSDIQAQAVTTAKGEISRLRYVWYFVTAVTVIAALVAESADVNTFIVLAVAITVSIKGQLVIDHFMAMRHENQRLRRILHAYFYVIPLSIVMVYLFPGLFH